MGAGDRRLGYTTYTYPGAIAAEACRFLAFLTARAVQHRFTVDDRLVVFDDAFAAEENCVAHLEVVGKRWWRPIAAQLRHVTRDRPLEADKLDAHAFPRLPLSGANDHHLALRAVPQLLHLVVGVRAELRV